MCFCKYSGRPVLDFQSPLLDVGSTDFLSLSLPVFSSCVIKKAMAE